MVPQVVGTLGLAQKLGTKRKKGKQSKIVRVESVWERKKITKTVRKDQCTWFTARRAGPWCVQSADLVDDNLHHLEKV